MSSAEDFQFSEIIQLPAIRKPNGDIQVLNPEMNRIPRDMLRQMAEMMGGELYFWKARAVIIPVDDASLCTHDDCYTPVVKGSHKCDIHQNKSN